MNSIIDTAASYRSEVLNELVHNILPFYLNHAIDEQQGGFYGFITDEGKAVPSAPKGLIQNSRVLWTFSHAYRALNDAVYLTVADRAYAYLLEHFWDAEHGGFYWTITRDGHPKDANKLSYGQAFCVYGLSEYYLATRNPQAIGKAFETYHLLEDHFGDPVYGGYIEGGSREWAPSGRVSLDDAVAAKSMNTQLHVLEAYTNLLRARDDAGLRRRLRDEIDVMVNHNIDAKTWHFKLHFDADWRTLNDHVSYGHDIEGSWLLVEAADVLGDANLLDRLQNVAVRMAQATYAEGLDDDGSLPYERGPHGLVNPNKDWWPQAEAMVGFLNAYQITCEPHFYDASLRAWQFIQDKIIDREHGEWFWGVTPSGEPIEQGKSGPWKCPYHNSRACLEVHLRLGDIMDN